MNDERIYKVSELNRAAKRLLEEGIGAIWLRGEVSNLRRAASGHLYFTLKDESSEISAVRFRGRTDLLPTPPLSDGMEVLAFGRLTIYAPRGRYQFVASIIQPAGLGALQAEFERLKRKLNSEGLFSPEHKRPLPQFPERIGVITSPTGAAVRDIISVISRRWPLAEIYLFPSQVQGEQAPEEIISGIEAAQRFSTTVARLDLLIVGRGGGSIEDLAPFNDERVARAAFKCEVPIISAVGHEIDFTIIDFVADRRAPTPSAAAELAVPNRTEIAASVAEAVARALRGINQRLERSSRLLESTLRGYIFRIPIRRLETAAQGLDLRLAGLGRATREAYLRRARRLELLSERLRLVDPRLPLARGYSITRKRGETRPLTSAEGVGIGDVLETIVEDGRIISEAKEVTVEDR
ncbi:exodeoxyribonuclease VII large subunit [Candidatus Bipolaricaulota bacterium]|nr:exodeoxyribonuclease VII large subunit [Candidatus Bipolaricaulota bacterium]